MPGRRTVEAQTTLSSGQSIAVSAPLLLPLAESAELLIGIIPNVVVVSGRTPPGGISESVNVTPPVIPIDPCDTGSVGSPHGAETCAFKVTVLPAGYPVP